MGALYLWLDLLTLGGPLILSFDKKVAFYKHWKAVGLGFLLVGIPFIVWDIVFTEHGIWGFNPDYLVGISIFGLPIEEILFFLVVPYGCTFIYACVKAYFPKANFSKFNLFFYAGFILYGMVASVLGWGGIYTMVTVAAALILVPVFYKNRERLHHLPIAFLIALIPFFIVNGVLTGAVTDAPIVWYNDLENTGVRWVTIPMDDIIYAWVLLSGNILVFSKMNKVKESKSLIR